jgi:hypothetical protein
MHADRPTPRYSQQLKCHRARTATESEEGTYSRAAAHASETLATDRKGPSGTAAALKCCF